MSNKTGLISTGIRTDAVILFAISATAYLFAVWSGSQGFFPFDQSIVFDGGYRVLLGQIPHVDFFSSFGPVTYWLQALFFKWWGVNLIAPVRGAGVLNVIACTCVYAMVRMLFPSRKLPAAVAGIVTAIFFFGPFGYVWFEQNAHTFSLIAMTLVLAGLGADRAGRGRIGAAAFAVAGIFAATAFITRQNSGLLTMPLLLVMVLGYPGLSLKSRVFALFAIAFGFVAGAGLFAGWLFAVSDFDRFIYDFFTLPSALGRSRLNENIGRTVLAILIGGRGPLDLFLGRFLLSAGCIGIGLWLRRKMKSQHPQSTVDLVVLIAATLFVIGNLTAFTTLNNLENAMPFVGIIAGLCVGMTLEWAGHSRRLGAVALALALAVSGFLGARMVQVAGARTVLDIFAGSTFEPFPVYPGFKGMAWGHPTTIRAPAQPEELALAMPPEDVTGLLDWLKASGGRFFVFPDFTALYGLAGVAPPQPSLFFAPGQSYDAANNDELDQRIVDSLEQAGVQCVVMERVSWFGTANRLAHFPRLKAWIDKHFTETRSFGIFQVLERIDGQSSGL